MTTLDIQVSADADDGRWDSNGTFQPGGTGGASLQVGVFSTARNTFWRFTPVPVAQGETIDVAYVEWRSSSTTSTSSMATVIRAIDEDDADAPTTASEASSATRTSAAVTHDSIPSASQNAWYELPSLVSVVQEIVDRAGWVSGNAMVILWEDDGSVSSTRSSYPHEVSSASAGILHLEYVPSNTAPTITVAPSASYGSLTRTGPNNTPAVVSFTATDAEETGADELSYEIRTATGGGGTLVASGTCTSGASKNVNIAYNASGLSEGSNTLYLRVSDGTEWTADSSFTLLVDTSAPTVGTITHSPNPVEP